MQLAVEHLCQFLGRPGLARGLLVIAVGCSLETSMARLIEAFSNPGGGAKGTESLG